MFQYMRGFRTGEGIKYASILARLRLYALLSAYVLALLLALAYLTPLSHHPHRLGFLLMLDMCILMVLDVVPGLIPRLSSPGTVLANTLILGYMLPRVVAISTLIVLYFAYGYVDHHLIHNLSIFLVLDMVGLVLADGVVIVAFRRARHVTEPTMGSTSSESSSAS